MISAFLEALCCGDEVRLSQCFSEDGKLFDYCPCVNGEEANIVYGRSGIELFYRSIFAVKKLTAAEPDIDGQETGTFFGSYNGPYIYCRATITECSEDGKIRRAVIVPA